MRLAGHLAQALRPAGYDGEVVYLIAALQSLGRLLLRYHFADEAEQIHQLTQPMPATRIDGETRAGAARPRAKQAAAYAVLGVDIETLGSAAARHWGLGDEVLHMIRRLPGDVAVRKPDDDNELLRIVASAANEIVDALGLPATKVSAALNQVIARYARTLRLTTRIVHDAIEDAKEALHSDGMRAAFRPVGEEDDDSGSTSRPTTRRPGRRRARAGTGATPAPLRAVTRG